MKRRVSLIRLVHQKEMYKLHNQIQQFVAVVGSTKVRLSSAPHEEFLTTESSGGSDGYKGVTWQEREESLSRERGTRILGLSQGKAFLLTSWSKPGHR